MEIKSKIELKDKGQTANLPTVKKLLVTLTWKSAVDLDLMAFYEKHDGSDGGVYTKNLGGSHGDLNKFPYMQLSGDEGVGASGGDNEENIRITNLDQIKKLYVIAINYTDAKEKNSNASFQMYDGRVSIVNEKGESFEVPLTSSENGTAALICSIDNSNPIGAVLKREDKVMGLETFVTTIPGAKALIK